jgi:hypothetical protein
LDGVQTRYENPKPSVKKIAEATPEEATAGAGNLQRTVQRKIGGPAGERD